MDSRNEGSNPQGVLPKVFLAEIVVVPLRGRNSRIWYHIYRAPKKKCLHLHTV